MSEDRITTDQALDAIRDALDQRRQVTVTIDGGLVIRRFGEGDPSYRDIPQHLSKHYNKRDREAWELGVAWQEAEAALPEGWIISEVTRASYPSWGDVVGIESEWTARATEPYSVRERLANGELADLLQEGPTKEATGPTHAAALRALTAKLKEGRE